jgi:hypothetical protein
MFGNRSENESRILALCVRQQLLGHFPRHVARIVFAVGLSALFSSSSLPRRLKVDHLRSPL